MGKKDRKSKKITFLKRRQEKRDKKKRQRKKSLKKLINPLKQMKSLPAERIKELLEDAPLLLQEPEFEKFTFKDELVEKYTTSTLEDYKERFNKNQEKSSSKKRKIYEDFCLDAISKLVNKVFQVSLKKRLRTISNRLKTEKNSKEQLLRAIVSEATISITQIPLEAHPLVVGMYEEKRREIMKDFVIPGFESVSYWQDRVKEEREEEKTVRFSYKDADAIKEVLNNNKNFQLLTDEDVTSYKWFSEEPTEEDTSESGILKFEDSLIVIKTISPKLAKEATVSLQELLNDKIELFEIDDDDEDDEDDNSKVDSPVDDNTEIENNIADNQQEPQTKDENSPSSSESNDEENDNTAK